ncbi:MAG: LysM peptidoglycan-binding domain-containing protein [Thermoflexales bacterium]|nr:LysM peptidoglycan-binding domain-containing protein [Thermoflexales bacterium]
MFISLQAGYWVDSVWNWVCSLKLICFRPVRISSSGAGRLVQAASVTATLAYAYTVDGLRVAQSVDGAETTFAWDWAAPVPELLVAGNTRYLVGHETLGWAEGGGWRYILPDALGSVRQTVDVSGAVVSAREWEPYGEEVGGAQAGLGYTGEWWDAEVGLLYLRARWYQPSTGRFTQPDPFGLPALYAYASDDPVNRVDPSGYIDWAQCSVPSLYDPPGRLHREYGTCRIQPGDTLFSIARQIRDATGIGEDDLWALVYAIQTYNNVYQKPHNRITDPNRIRAGDWLALPPEWILAVRSYQGTSVPSPDISQIPGTISGISGYLEGTMETSTFACITFWIRGREVVYNFAMVPPARARFGFSGFGFATSYFDITATSYAGVVWGFSPGRSQVDLFRKEYEGWSVSLSVGANVTIPREFIGLFGSLGGGFGASRSLTSNVFVLTAYTSAGMGVGEPGISLNVSLAGVQYQMAEGSLYTYTGAQGLPDLASLKRDIASGTDSPMVVSIMREPIADYMYGVVQNYYHTYGFPHND